MEKFLLEKEEAVFVIVAKTTLQALQSMGEC